MKIRKELFLCVVSMVVAVLLAEIILRVSKYNYCPLLIKGIDVYHGGRLDHLKNYQCFEADPVLIWRPKKSQGVFNAQGLRGQEVSLKSKNEFRILVLGDSYACGPTDTPPWAHYLEEMLRSHNPNIIVLNAGVWGYSSLQAARRLKQCLVFKPDLVLLNWCSNDALAVSVPDRAYLKMRMFLHWSRWSLWRLRLFQLCWAAYDRFFLKKGIPTELVPRVALEEYRQYLSSAVILARKHHFGLVLLSRPYTVEIGGLSDWKRRAPAYETATLSASSIHGIPVIDAWAYFYDKKALFFDESHLNDTGQREMAKLVAGYLQEHKIVPEKQVQ